MAAAAGDQIRRVRVAAGLSQDELATRAGVRQPNLAAIESGTRHPSAKMVERLLTAAKPLPSEALRLHRAELLEIAQRHHARDVRVFGSVARGEDHPGSDIDLLVRFDPGTTVFDVAALIDEAEALFGLSVDVVSEGGLKPRHASILAEAVSV